MGLLKKAAIGLLGLLVSLTGLAVGAVALLWLAFDPSWLKQPIENNASAFVGRDVRLAQAPGLSLWPGLGIQTGPVVVASPPAFGQPLARIENVRVEVALWPLLQRSILIDEVLVQGPQVNLITMGEQSNWDQLFPENEEDAGGEFSTRIDSVTLKRGALRWVDLAQATADDSSSDLELAWVDISATTGAISVGPDSGSDEIQVSAAGEVLINQDTLGQVQTELSVTLGDPLEIGLRQLALDLTEPAMTLNGSGQVVVNLNDASIAVHGMVVKLPGLMLNADNLSGGWQPEFSLQGPATFDGDLIALFEELDTEFPLQSGTINGQASLLLDPQALSFDNLTLDTAGGSLRGSAAWRFDHPLPWTADLTSQDYRLMLADTASANTSSAAPGSGHGGAETTDPLAAIKAQPLDIRLRVENLIWDDVRASQVRLRLEGTPVE